MEDNTVVDETNETVEEQNNTTQTTETVTTEASQASLPMPYAEYIKLVGPPLVQYFGRKVLYDDYTDSDLNSGTDAQRVSIVNTILNHVWPVHMENVNQISYLEDYYKGFQPILGKHKDVRPTINNIIIENNAFWAVNFKVGYVFGSPFRFIQKGDVANAQIDILNNYVQAEDKYAKDSELAESLYTSGIAHRLVLPTPENENSPFSIKNLDSKCAFIVYSSRTGEELMGVSYSKGVYTGSIVGSVYTRTGYYEFTMGNPYSEFSVTFKQKHILNTIPIFEYRLNKWRLGIIEVVMSIFNAINRVSSGDLDGLEQYIQSILVFINNEIDKETYRDILDLGAVQLNTADPSRPADVKMLQNEIKHDNTKILHDRLLNTALQIIGIPTPNERASGGDTGMARQLSDGWEMANRRAMQDENSFKSCSKPEVELMLSICEKQNSGITTLTMQELEMKSTRNNSDNFLTKAQGMSNLITSGVSPDVAFATSGLFSDSNDVYTKSMDFYGGEEGWINAFIKKLQSATVSKIPDTPNKSKKDDYTDMNDSNERIAGKLNGN